MTVMATRGQDQDLVASVADQHAIRDRSELEATSADQGTSLRKIVPAFGWHPWFSHQLYDDSATNEPRQKEKHYASVLQPTPDADFIAGLPDPIPLSQFLAETRARLEAHPTAIIGEVGLDKAFRLPWGWKETEKMERDEELTPGGREGRMLSPHHVKMAQQTLVLKAQLRLAGELGRGASVHGVQAHGVLFEALSSLWKGHEKEVLSRRKRKMVAAGAEDFSDLSDEEEESEGEDGPKKERKPKTKPYKPKPFPPRICLHSFSGPPQMMTQYLNPAVPAKIFFSFSMCVNLGTPGGEGKFADVIRACPDDQLLVESDLHTAGDRMDRELELMTRKICEVKGWSLEEGVKRLRKNYESFIFGDS